MSIRISHSRCCPSTFHPTQLQPCLHHTNLHCSERSSFLLVDHIYIDIAVGVPYKFCICTLVGGEASYRHPYNVCPGHNAAGLQLRCAAHSDTSSCCYWQVGAVFYTCTPSPTHTHTYDRPYASLPTLTVRLWLTSRATRCNWQLQWHAGQPQPCLSPKRWCSPSRRQCSRMHQELWTQQYRR